MDPSQPDHPNGRDSDNGSPQTGIAHPSPSLILYTTSILHNPIHWNPFQLLRSNSELLHSLDTMLTWSLDDSPDNLPPCPPHVKLPNRGGVGSDGEQGEREGDGEAEVVRYGPCYAFDQGNKVVQIPDPRDLVRELDLSDDEGDEGEGHVGLDGTAELSSSSTSGTTTTTTTGVENKAKRRARTSREKRSGYDITAKFFFLSPPPSSSSANPNSRHYTSSSITSALHHLRLATDIRDLDTLILSFPGFTFDRDDEDDDDRDDDDDREGDGEQQVEVDGVVTGGGGREGGGREGGGMVGSQDKDAKDCGRDVDKESQVRMDEVMAIWKDLSGNPSINSLGLSEFSLQRLKKFISLVDTPSPPKPSTTTNGFQPNGTTATTNGSSSSPTPTSSGLKPLTVDQINLRDCCSVPTDLIVFAREKGIELFTHSDCSDLLPPKTFTNLLSKFSDRLPLDLLVGKHQDQVRDDDKDDAGRSGEEEEEVKRLNARWVLKYTVVIKDRNVVADKGYIVMADLI